MVLDPNWTPPRPYSVPKFHGVECGPQGDAYPPSPLAAFVALFEACTFDDDRTDTLGYP